MPGQASHPAYVRAVRVVDEVLGPFDAWPANIRASFLSRHWRYGDRFMLAVFFACNGTNPALLLDVAMSGGCLRDAAALAHLNGIIHSCRYDIEFRRRYYSYSLYCRQYEYLDGTPVLHLLQLPGCCDCGREIGREAGGVACGDVCFCVECMGFYESVIWADGE
jgi:hypothetical protein